MYHSCLYLRGEVLLLFALGFFIGGIIIVDEFLDTVFCAAISTIVVTVLVEHKKKSSEYVGGL